MNQLVFFLRIVSLSVFVLSSLQSVIQNEQAKRIDDEMTETCQICIKMKSFYRRVNTAVHRNNGGCYSPYYLYLHHLSCHHSPPDRPQLITYIQISNRTATKENTLFISMFIYIPLNNLMDVPRNLY